MEEHKEFDAGIQVIKSYIRSQFRDKNIEAESIETWHDHSRDLPHKLKFIVNANRRFGDFTVTRELECGY
jgi:hypothetical protein